MKKKIYYTALALLSFFVFSACESILDIEPETNVLLEDEALENEEDILEFLNSCYDVSANYLGGRAQMFSDVLGDDIALPNSDDLKEVYNHNTLFFNGSTGGFYEVPYQAIFRGNRILEFIDDFSFSLSEKERIVGEVYFLRALAHFKIVELYAQPPAYTSDNSHDGIIYKMISESQVLPRASVGENYQSIITDLTRAIDLLPEANGVYANQDAARALLAKVYYRLGNYTEAINLANTIINSGKYSLGTNVDRFLTGMDASESIWSTVSFIDGDIIDTRSDYFSGNYRQFNDEIPLLRASLDFYNIYAADTNDQRIKDFYEVQGTEPDEIVLCKKFSKDFFNVPVFHLTDLKLMRAEAIAESGGDLSTAIQDVNDIKERAYGGTQNNLATSASASEVIDAARYERRIEMFGEGDRIHQLKRRGGIEGESILIRQHTWDCNGMVIQFPISEKTDLFELNPTGGC
jgi:tetratricopeptide (TPR) repeat protein